MVKNQVAKRLGNALALVAALSWVSNTVAPRRADAAIGVLVSAPVAIVSGAVIAGATIVASDIGLHSGGYNSIVAIFVVSYVGIPALVLGLIILPADLSAQYRFPELAAAPAGVSEAELADYRRDRPVLELLAQDVRANLAHDLVSDDQWKTMSKADRMAWAEARRQQANQHWEEYVGEGLVSRGALKVLGTLSQE